MLNKDKISEIVEAKKKIAEGDVVIWRTRLEMLSRAGGLPSIMEFIASPVGPQEDTTNNCNCPNTVPGCGAPPRDIDDILSGLPKPPTDDGPDLPDVND